jgi:hypothetical protein
MKPGKKSEFGLFSTLLAQNHRMQARLARTLALKGPE